MGPFRENAFYLLLWRAILAVLIAVILMATCSYRLGTTLLVGAHVALFFSCGLFFWASRLDEEGVVRARAWRMLAPRERPAGLPGRRWARNYLKEVELRFAKAASVAAITLATLALAFVEE